MTPQQIFHKVYDGAANFITPNIVKYGTAGRFVYEVSRGEGFHTSTIYGFTVVDKVTMEPAIYLCKKCDSEAEIDECITNLKRIKKNDAK